MHPEQYIFEDNVFYTPSGKRKDIVIIQLDAPWTNCAICDKDIRIASGGFSLPMYEDEVVNPDKHEWAGFPVCEECYKANEHLMYVGDS